MFRKISVFTVAMLFLLTAIPAKADHHKTKIINKEGIGAYVTGAKGMTLYYFVKDGAGKSTCAGDCLQKWPPYTAEKVQPQTGLNAMDFSTLMREDGKPQVVYKGYPLYYFFKDLKAGDTNGQGVNGVWFVVNPAVFPPMK